MKNYLILGSVFAAVLSLTACAKNNGCPASSEKAKVRVFEDDSCGTIFELTDGTKLEPTNLSEFQVLEYQEGMLVWLKYRATSGASRCGLGDIVRLKCISEREF
jgi:hypothetical protein